MRINAGRLQESLRQMSEIGATAGGGVSRMALSDEDKAARDLLRRWMEEAGLEVLVDDLGNMRGRRPGREAGPAVMLGSHLDTPELGGIFDGTIGVLGALEIVRTLNDHEVTTRYPVEIVNFTNEEGARFEPAMQGSGVVAGVFSRDYIYSRTDQQGLRIDDELRRIGYLGDAAARPAAVRAFLELHNEQNARLDEAELPVGVVEGVNGITWSEVTIEGEANNGPTPMRYRHDAMLAAARVIDGVDRIVRELDDEAMGTVGRIKAEPNIINVIPGKVVFTVDLRHPDNDRLDLLVERVEGLLGQVCTEVGVAGRMERFWTSQRTPFDPQVIDAVQTACEEIGAGYLRLWSGAGHDARYMADICPTGMIFIRNKDGHSHREDEYCAPEDVEASVNVMLLATMMLAKAEVQG